MSDTGSFSLGDSWLGQGASWLGDQVSGAGNWLANQFGFGGDSSSAAAPSSNDTTGGISPANTNFVTSSLGGFGGTPSAPGMSSGDVNAANAFVSTGAPSSATSALSYNGPGANPDSVMAGSGAKTNAPAASQSIMDSLGLSNKDLLKGGISGAGLVANLAMGGGSNSAEKQLKGIAAGQSAQGQQLQSYLASGTLPPGAQQWVDNQTAAQKASIKSKYANLGMSGSTAETQELNQVDANASAQMFQIATELLNTGVSETGASGTLYNYLMQAQNADQKDVSGAIQNFVTSLAGGSDKPKSINVNL